MKGFHYLFFLLFAQSIYIKGVYLAIFILASYTSLRIFVTKKIKKISLIFAIPLMYWIWNLVSISNPSQLLYLAFYRYDGKFIPVFIILLLLINSIYYKNFTQYINRIKLFIALIWILTFIGFNPLLNTSLFESHNANAGFIGSIILINLIILMRFNHLFRFHKPLTFGITIYFTILFLNYFSRAFFLGLFLSLILLIFIEKKNRSLKNIFYFISFLGIFLMFTLFFSNLPERFILAITEPEEDWNVITRLAIWQLAIDLWTKDLKTLIFGMGIGMFNDITIVEIYKSFSPDRFYFGERHSHNIILHLLVEQGILGLLLFFSPFLYVYLKLKKVYFYSKSDISSFNLQIFTILFTYLFIASQFGLNFFTPSTSIIFYVFLANIINTINLEVKAQ